jgi:hypothetical protein
MGSGKTYMSDFLIKEAGYTRMSFAGSLKQIEEYLSQYSAYLTFIYLMRTFNDSVQIPFKYWWTMYSILRETAKIPRETPKPRKRLQFLGNTVRDRISKSYWLDLAADEYRQVKARDPNLRVVFDDARYPNEIERLKFMGFTTIKLETTPDVRLNRLKKLYGITDQNDPRLWAESENCCDDKRNKFDHKIVNDDDGKAIEAFREIIVNNILAQDFIDQLLKEK